MEINKINIKKDNNNKDQHQEVLVIFKIIIYESNI